MSENRLPGWWIRLSELSVFIAVVIMFVVDSVPLFVFMSLLFLWREFVIYSTRKCETDSN